MEIQCYDLIVILYLVVDFSQFNITEIEILCLK